MLCCFVFFRINRVPRENPGHLPGTCPKADTFFLKTKPAASSCRTSDTGTAPKGCLRGFPPDIFLASLCTSFLPGSIDEYAILPVRLIFFQLFRQPFLKFLFRYWLEIFPELFFQFFLKIVSVTIYFAIVDFLLTVKYFTKFESNVACVCPCIIRAANLFTAQYCYWTVRVFRNQFFSSSVSANIPLIFLIFLTYFRITVN